MTSDVKHHPIRGLMGGLCLGIARSIFAMVFGVVVVGSAGAIGIIAAGTLLGVVIVYVLPPKGGKGGPATASVATAAPPAPGTTPQPS